MSDIEAQPPREPITIQKLQKRVYSNSFSISIIGIVIIAYQIGFIVYWFQRD